MLSDEEALGPRDRVSAGLRCMRRLDVRWRRACFAESPAT